MDIPEEYVKMCDYPGIQNQWKPRQGDVFTKRSDWPPKFHLYMCNVEEWTPRKQDLRFYIWLPHQGQIQEMMGLKNPRDMLFRGNCLFPMTRYFSETFESFEQLWLAFYIYEKHNKVWDGEKWINRKVRDDQPSQTKKGD